MTLAYVFWHWSDAPEFCLRTPREGAPPAGLGAAVVACNPV